MRTVNGKNPIVNGSVNPSLTLQECVQFDLDIKDTLTHYLRVGIDYPHKYEYPTQKEWIEEGIKNCGIDLNVSYETYSNDPNKYLPLFWEANERITRFVNGKRKDFQFEQGKKIRQAQKELGFKGRFDLSFGQMLGYVTEVGQWNDFEPYLIKRAIRKTEQDLPRVNYGINNPNTGNKRHQWSVDGDYITLSSGYCTGDELERWKAFRFELEAIWRSTKADSFRFEINTSQINPDNPPIECGITYIFWWD